MRAVMYNYGRGEGQRLPDYYHLAVEDFRAQLDYLEAEYGFVEYDGFIRALGGETETLPDGVVLTFDDGFRDHYEVVYPELVERELWGTSSSRLYRDTTVTNSHTGKRAGVSDVVPSPFRRRTDGWFP